jgi:triacylglycerol esterase/lipase EstA (alpha/beta hydrolase family)
MVLPFKQSMFFLLLLQLRLLFTDFLKNQILVFNVVSSIQFVVYMCSRTYPEFEVAAPTLKFDFLQVISVIKRHPGVQKISFIGHSLGGLVARYAIAKLYGRDIKRDFSPGNGECRTNGSGDLCVEEKFHGKIAGLEPVNFITSATPHLGSRGHKQVILFFFFDK